MRTTHPTPRQLVGDLSARAQHAAAVATERVRRATHPIDPAEALFQRIGWRLAAMYTAALGAMLLIVGLVLYLGVQHALLGPVSDNLQYGSQQIAAAWQSAAPEVQARGCPVPISVVHDVPYIVCYSPQNGFATLPGAVNQPPEDFTSVGLIQSALNAPSGQAWDTIVDTHGLGAIRRHALVVHTADGAGVLGVVMVGVPIQGELTALRVLLALLLVLGVLALAGAVLGGVVLSRRALAPARLALQRQQAFISDAAHELRTPLTIMRANAELLLHSRERLDPEDAELLEDIVAEAAHMGTLAASMLELARLDAGMVPLEREVVDLGELARSLARRAQALAAERQLTLTVNVAPGVLVLADRMQLDEVALILLDNAIKYNQPGGTVTLSVTRAGPHALLSVADSGPGIADEHLARLGERFYRVDKARSRAMGGAGLGLSIARRIAAAHGGTLAFASVPGQGTTVTLNLPAAE
jgi:signal transduction histidine kinase